MSGEPSSPVPPQIVGPDTGTPLHGPRSTCVWIDEMPVDAPLDFSFGSVGLSRPGAGQRYCFDCGRIVASEIETGMHFAAWPLAQCPEGRGTHRLACPRQPDGCTSEQGPHTCLPAIADELHRDGRSAARIAEALRPFLGMGPP